jgi:hypothetical protein
LYYIEQSISPVRDAAGSITHFISNGRDLTVEPFSRSHGYFDALFVRTEVGALVDKTPETMAAV